MSRLLAFLGLLLALGAPAHALSPRTRAILAPNPCNGVTLKTDFVANGGGGVFCLNGQRYASFTAMPGASYSGSVSGAGATVRTAANSAGAVMRFADGAPRITDLGLLVEEARTNLITQSQALDNAAWSPLNTTVSPNATIAPDGSFTADAVIESAISAGHSIGSAGVLVFQQYSISFFAKPNGRNVIQGAGGGLSGHNEFPWWDLATGTAGNPGTGAAVATISPAANGWYRCVLLWTLSAGNNFQIVLTNTAVGSPGAGSPSYLGDGVSGVYVWGVQAEQAPFPTSYIPTTSAAVARAADVAAVSGVSLPVAPWTLFGQAYYPTLAAQSGGIVAVDDGPAGNNQIELWMTSTGKPRTILSVGGINTYDSGALFAAVTAPATLKMAATYAGGQITSQAQGAALATTAATAPTTDITGLRFGVLNGGVSPTNAYIQRAALYPTANFGLSQ